MIDSTGESNIKADHSIIQVEENEDELIASWIGRQLRKESTEEPVHTCIFRVPTKHVGDNENAFVPQVVSIGPYHRGREKVQGMEQIKLEYLQSLLDGEPIPDTSLVKFVKEIRSREEFLRKCYEEKLYHLSSKEFVEMMVVDGCFILELLRDSVSLFPERLSRNDLLLLENQLPWQVLDCLFNLTKKSGESSLYQLTLGLSEKVHYPVGTETSEIRHLLDAVRNALFSSPWLENRESDWIPIPSVTHLEEIGVKFKIVPSTRLLDITFDFENGVMEIPSLIIRSNTESLFRNLIAYEQHRSVGNSDNSPILSYAFLLNQLIRSTEDLDSLSGKGIIYNELSVVDTVCFFNRLLYDTEHKIFFYTDLAIQVNRYWDGRWLRRCLLWITKDYLYNPSSIWSVSNAVIFFLILTVVQTVYTVLAYYK